jgi:hypothetical protein
MQDGKPKPFCSTISGRLEYLQEKNNYPDVVQIQFQKNLPKK